MKRLLLLTCSLLCICTSRAQLGLSYYPVTSYVGLSVNANHTLWGDLRLQTNTFVGFSNVELSPKVNLKNTALVKIYAGAGINLNFSEGAYDGRYVNGYFICGGVSVSPFREVRNVGFIFECSPYINDGFSDGMIRTTLGLSWQFQKNKKSETK